MLAHVHGQTLNWSELGRSMSVADTTVRNYLDILDGALVVTTLKPWHENISKRQVKSPKVYLRDAGLLHSLLDIETLSHLEGHPKVGASWEGFVIQQLTRQLDARPEQCFYWATHAGAELDLLVVDGPRRLGFEIKLTDAPSVTASMHAALTDLKLDAIDVVHAGDNTYPLSERVRAVAAVRVLEDVNPLRPVSRARQR
jgi:predicted AAA+ superfamily ATPase